MNRRTRRAVATLGRQGRLPRSSDPGPGPVSAPRATPTTAGAVGHTGLAALGADVCGLVPQQRTANGIYDATGHGAKIGDLYLEPGSYTREGLADLVNRGSKTVSAEVVPDGVRFSEREPVLA